MNSKKEGDEKMPKDNNQVELATTLLEDLAEDGYEDLSVLDLLDSLARQGLELARNTTSNPASDAYIAAITNA